MAIQRRKKFAPHVESSSMSDIMFFLFLFFLIISTMANPNVIKVPLPEAKTTTNTPENHLTVTIDSEKRYYIDKDQVDIERLEGEIVRRTQELGDDMVVIRPAKDVEVQLLIDLLQMGLKNNLKFVIATKAG
jgi:biopolymer transport protein ExbD